MIKCPQKCCNRAAMPSGIPGKSQRNRKLTWEIKEICKKERCLTLQNSVVSNGFVKLDLKANYEK